MANARTRKIRLQFDGNILELSATDPDVGGDSREALAITHNGEGSFCIGFNGQFLAEILGMCKSEEVIMKMNNRLHHRAGWRKHELLVLVDADAPHRQLIVVRKDLKALAREPFLMEC